MGGDQDTGMDRFFLYHLVLAACTLLFLLPLRRERGAFPLVLLVGGFVAAIVVAAHFFCYGKSGFYFLRLLAAGVFVELPLGLLLGALLQRGRSGLLFGLAASIVAGIGFWAFFVEPRRLEIERIEIRSDKLEAPLRVVVVADLQTDVIGEYEKEALALMLAEKGDLILFTGDYVQEKDPAKHLALRRELNSFLHQLRLEAPLGIYAVRGDVERNDWQDLFAGLPIKTFEQTTRIELPQLTLTALRLGDSRHDRAVVEPSERFHLIFGHAPDFALFDPPADLLVAGHTHGGQVRLPFIGPLLTFSRVPRAWAAGHTEISPVRHLVVSRGIGMERGDAPRLRFLCRPQIVTIDLLPEAAASEPATKSSGR
jgi:predicted MPP superfamily phosphohydrolase